MAKKTVKYVFKNFGIEKEDGKYILTEVSKDNTETYDLSSILDEMIGTEGNSMSFGSEDIVPSI